MAKKNKDNDEEEFMDSESGKEGGGGFVTALTVIIIVVIWLVIFGILIKTDFMGFGSSVLAPVLKDIPVINKILPESATEDEGMSTSATGINDDQYESLEEANAQINKLQDELIEKTEKIETDKETIASLKKDVSRLKKYKDAFDDFDELKKEFDEEVVFGENALSYEEYMKYYEQIEPENAEEIYRQCVEQQQGDAKIQAQAKIYSEMEASNAAAILENMTGDLDLVCHILSTIKEEQASEILAAMDTNFASKITKKMSVME
jgi:flagellar motility protein MotE (MotC chaperone)